MKVRMVKEAEAYLSAARLYLEELQSKVQTCGDPSEKKKLENSLEQDRIRHAQLSTYVVLFKAANGIFTDPVNTKKLK